VDYRKMFDSKYIGSWDLPKDRDAVVKVSKVEAGELVAEGNKKSRKPVVSFQGKQRKLALNKTNARIMHKLFGPDTTTWIGKVIAIYPTTTKFGRETVDCVRIRPRLPGSKEPLEQDPLENEPPPDAVNVDDFTQGPDDEQMRQPGDES
jgi:hypothetical protein